MSETVIKVEQLSKQYRLGAREGYKTFRETLVEASKAPFALLSTAMGRKRKRMREIKTSMHYTPDAPPAIQHGQYIWALKNVSFEVKRGDIVGIIGRNGAGKSTLLKILSKITEPTTGRIEYRGRVGSLLEIGTGFHPELTGHENVYLYGAILGMDRWEVTHKFDEIVAFAELEKFIDTPMKRYSSGMHMRLAFSVAAHLEPDILLIDEVLAVGDYAFKKKCISKMGEIGSGGRTILFISHNMGQITSLCNSAILLNDGKIVTQGTAQEVCTIYINEFSNQEETENPNRRENSCSILPPGPKIEQVAIVDSNGNYRSKFSSNEKFKIQLKIKPDQVSEKPFTAVWFLHDNIGRQIAVGASFPMDSITFPQTTTKIECLFNPVSLLEGFYSLRFVFHIPLHYSYDDWKNAISFEITDSDVFHSGFAYPGVWMAQQYVEHKWRRL